jgi:hypothetical protein
MQIKFSGHSIFSKVLAGTFLVFLGLLPIFPAIVMAEVQARPQSVFLDVPFTLQAPLGEWNDPRQRDGCEEASILMAMMWTWGTGVPAEEARREILNMADYEQVFRGFHQDTSAQDTARLIREYYGNNLVEVRENIGVEDIKNELAAGRLVMVPLNTKLLSHPYYKNGPVRHTVVAVGYDDQSGVIIVHDPMFKSGQNLHLKQGAVANALWNYSSGVHKPLGTRNTALISVGK